MKGSWSFVGRDHDLEHLCALVTRERTESAGAVLVGTAGVGKTRLLTEVLARARAAGVRVRLIAATESAAGVPLGCLTALLAPRLTAERGPIGPEALFHEAVAALMSEATAGERWLLAVDDLPRLDPASAAVIHQVLFMTGAQLIATARLAEPRPSEFDVLWGEGQLELLSLDPLGDEAIDKLLVAAVDGPIEARSRRRIVHLAAGNPLALRELLASAKDTGALQNDGGVWCLGDGFQAGIQVSALVDRRLAQLEPAARRGLEILALAEPIDLVTLQELAGGEVVDGLIGRALIVVDGVEDGEGFEHAVARSAHPLFAEVLRSQLPPGRRRRLNAELLAALPEDRSGGPAPSAGPGWRSNRARR